MNNFCCSVFRYHDGLKKWVEVGNSGMFRPEMLLPMGLPEGVNVIAWGLSLERYDIACTLRFSLFIHLTSLDLV